MGKRLFRLNVQEAIMEQASLIGHDLSFVLENRTVFLGVLRKIDGSLFVCENKLGKPFQFEAAQIKEIIYDKHSSY